MKQWVFLLGLLIYKEQVWFQKKSHITRNPLPTWQQLPKPQNSGAPYACRAPAPATVNCLYLQSPLRVSSPSNFIPLILLGRGPQESSMILFFQTFNLSFTSHLLLESGEPSLSLLEDMFHPRGACPGKTTLCLMPSEARRVGGIPWTKFQVVVNHHVGAGNPVLGPLEEQSVLEQPCS